MSWSLERWRRHIWYVSTRSRTEGKKQNKTESKQEKIKELNHMVALCGSLARLREPKMARMCEDGRCIQQPVHIEAATSRRCNIIWMRAVTYSETPDDCWYLVPCSLALDHCACAGCCPDFYTESGGEVRHGPPISIQCFSWWPWGGFRYGTCLEYIEGERLDVLYRLYCTFDAGSFR